MDSVFERFTDRARKVVVLAQEEARLLEHNYIGTEHILLGLIREGEGLAAKALASMRVSLHDARKEVEALIGRGTSPKGGHIPFTPRAKKVLELSLREALQLGHNYIGTEHLLLGLIREQDGVGAQVLKKFVGDLNRVRREVVSLLAGGAGETPPAERTAFLPHVPVSAMPFASGTVFAVEQAERIATSLGHATISPEDLFWGLLQAGSSEVLAAAAALGADWELIRRRLEEIRGAEEPPTEAPEA